MRKITGTVAAILFALTVMDAQDKTADRSNDATAKVLIANERALHEAVAKADKNVIPVPRPS